MATRIAGIAALALAIASSGCASLNGAIRKMDHAALRPPRTTLPPGTIIRIKGVSPLRVSIVCTAQQAFGSVPASERSDTLSQEWQSKTTSSFKLEAGYKDQIKATANGKYIRDVTLHLTNTEVRELSAATIQAAVNAGRQDPACVSAVRTYLGQGEKLSLVSSVLQADVLYTVKYDATTNAELQATITRDIAPKLVAEVGTVGTNTVSGKSLFWGVNDDRILLTMFLNGAGVQEGRGPASVGSPVLKSGFARFFSTGGDSDRSLLPAEAVIVEPD